MKVIKNTFLVILVAFLLVITIQNMDAFTHSQKFKVFNSQPIALPFAMWLLLSFAIGYCLAYILAVKKTFSANSEKKKLIKKNEALNQELQEHRNKFLESESIRAEATPVEGESNSESV